MIPYTDSTIYVLRRKWKGQSVEIMKESIGIQYDNTRNIAHVMTLHEQMVLSAIAEKDFNLILSRR